MTRVVLGVGPVLVSTVVPFWVDIHRATGIFIFLGSWNRYMWPLVMTRSDTMFVLPVGLATLKSDFIVQYGQLMAGATLSVVPIMLAFLFFQKQFVQGLTAGAVKG